MPTQATIHRRRRAALTVVAPPGSCPAGPGGVRFGFTALPGTPLDPVRLAVRLALQHAATMAHLVAVRRVHGALKRGSSHLI